MCLLLIGGGGFVGTNFLMRMDIKDLVVVVDPNDIKIVGNYIHYKQTIQEFVKQENFKKYDITKIICLAADSFVPTCGKDEFINNIEIAQCIIYLLRYYENWKYRKLGRSNEFCPSIPCLYFITDEVFDCENVFSYYGNHKKFNQSYYSMSKFITNELLKNYDVCLAYPPNLFGNYQKHDCIIKKILNNKLEYIEDTGEQKRYFMKIDFVIDACFSWLEKPVDTYEFNTMLFNNPWFKISINDLVEKVFGLTVPHKIIRREKQDKEYFIDYENINTELRDFKEIYDYINYKKKERPKLRRTPSLNKQSMIAETVNGFSNSSAESD